MVIGGAYIPNDYTFVLFGNYTVTGHTTPLFNKDSAFEKYEKVADDIFDMEGSEVDQYSYYWYINFKDKNSTLAFLTGECWADYYHPNTTYKYYLKYTDLITKEVKSYDTDIESSFITEMKYYPSYKTLFMNYKGDLLIINPSNYSAIKKIELNGEYNSSRLVFDKLVVLGNNNSLIFDKMDIINTLKVDSGTGRVKGIDTSENTVEKILNKLAGSEGFNLSDYTIEIKNNKGETLSNTSKVGTGTTIVLKQNGQIIKTYTIMIYGDCTGDGNINAIDALAIVKNSTGKVLFANDILNTAGKLLSSGTKPTAVDALAIVKYVTGKYIIDQEK